MAPKEKKKSKEKTKTFSEKEAPQKAQRRSSGSKKGAGNEAVAFFDATLPRQKKSAAPAAASAPAPAAAPKGRGRGRGRGGGGDGGGMNRQRKGSVMWPQQNPNQVGGTRPAPGAKANPSNNHVHLTSIYYRPTRPVGKSRLTRERGSRAAWDVGRISRGECEHAVLAAESGDFLVRHGSDGSSYVICVNDSNQSVHNFKAQVLPEGKIQFNNKAYDCLEEGIDQLRRQPLELPSGRTVYLAKSASHCKWFVGAMERAECGRLLMAAGNCDYLVRLQVTGERAEYEICINDKGHLARSSIMRSRAGDFVTAQGQFFASLGELLEHARDEAVFKGESGRSLYLRKVAAQADWYCAKLSRDHVEKYVGQSGVGGYLVRQSEKNPDDFVLVVKSKEAVLSFKIKRSDVGFTIRGDTYNSMESVIRHVTRNPLQNADGSPLELTKPAKRPIDTVKIFGEAEIAQQARLATGNEPQSSMGASKEVMAMEEMMRLAEKKVKDAGGFDEAEEPEEFDDAGESEPPAGGGTTAYGSKLDNPFRGVIIQTISQGDAEALGDKFIAVEENQPIFIFAGGDTTWGGVYQGSPGLVNKDNVKEETDEMADQRRAAQLDEAVAGFGDEDNGIDDSDDEEAEEAGEVEQDDDGVEEGGGFDESDFIDHDAAAAAAVADAEAAAAAEAAAKEHERLMAEIAAMDDEITGFD